MAVKGFWGEGVIFSCGEAKGESVLAETISHAQGRKFNGGHIKRRDESRRQLDGGEGEGEVGWEREDWEERRGRGVERRRGRGWSTERWTTDRDWKRAMRRSNMKLGKVII